MFLGKYQWIKQEEERKRIEEEEKKKAEEGGGGDWLKYKFAKYNHIILMINI